MVNEKKSGDSDFGGFTCTLGLLSGVDYIYISRIIIIIIIIIIVLIIII